MSEELSYILVTPYTIAKSRTGGVISRLLSRLDLELVGAQMFAPTKEFAEKYAEIIRTSGTFTRQITGELLSNYVLTNLSPSTRRHRVLMLLFRGENATRKLSDIAGAIYPENRGVESLTGETIRDTYSDLIMDPNDPKKVQYFEPAVLTPRSQDVALKTMELFADFIKDEPTVIENMQYKDKKKIERTLVLIKPDNWRYASSRPGTIIDMFSRTGLRIISVKVHRMSVSEALEFYGPVKNVLREKLAPVFGQKAGDLLSKEFKLELSEQTVRFLTESFGVEYAEDQFDQIIEFMSGRKPKEVPVDELNEPGTVKIMALVYEGENAVNRIREVLGPTDPTKAPGGTVRREFGSDVMVNTAHASDSPDNAQREMKVVKIQANNCQQVLENYLKSMKE